MLELGHYGRQAHRQVGQFIRSQRIDYVIALGSLSPEVVKAAFGDDLRGERWACCGSVEEVVSVLKEVAAPGDAVLIKGSRANGMERIVDGLKVAALVPSMEDAKIRPVNQVNLVMSCRRGRLRYVMGCLASASHFRWD
jgi:hypothetical protein